MAEPKQFFPGIHALRAVAAALVVVEHAAYVANDYSAIVAVFLFPPGRIGVILFFAISGFVIALQRTQPIAVFALHRILRIYPIYWIAMALAAGMMSLAGRQIGVTPSELLLAPSTAGNDLATIPYWTLTFEVAFYILSTIAFAARLSDAKLTVAAAAWIVAVNIFGMSAADQSAYAFPGALILLSPAAQVFPLGLICGIHFGRLTTFGRWPFVAVAIAAAIVSNNLEWFAPAKLFAVGLSCAMVIVAVADINVPSFVKRLGDASYGIYLLHFPLMLAVASVAPKSGFFVFLMLGLIGGATFGLFDHWLYGRMKQITAAHTSPPPPPPAR